MATRVSGGNPHLAEWAKKGGAATKGITRPNISSASGRVYATERAKLVARLRLEGTPVDDIARDLRLTQRQVINISNQAVEQGLVEGVRESLQRQLLPKLHVVLDDIMTKPASELADKAVLKGHELKLKAARHVADGLGVFRKTPATTMTETHQVDLQQYLALRERREPGEVVDAVASDSELPTMGNILPELGEGDDGLGGS